MLCMAVATSLFAIHKLRRNLIFVTIVLTLVTIGRIVLVLPFCAQPRFDIYGLHWIIGGIIFVLALAIGAHPCFTVKWWSPPATGMNLRTIGIYSLVRHPIYLCEVLWFLGWAIMFRSVYGIALAPVWWITFLIHALSEEADMERALGKKYLDYKKKVRGCIFPGLPF